MVSFPLSCRCWSLQLWSDQSERKGTHKDITFSAAAPEHFWVPLLYDLQHSYLGHNESVPAIMIPSINLSLHDL